MTFLSRFFGRRGAGKAPAPARTTPAAPECRTDPWFWSHYEGAAAIGRPGAFLKVDVALEPGTHEEIQKTLMLRQAKAGQLLQQQRHALGALQAKIRLAAQTLGSLCPSLLRPLNPPVAPSHRHAALTAALAFRVAPEGYRDDLLRCLGLEGEPSTARDVHDAARRASEFRRI